jgi:hypothetical protein
MLAIHDQFTRQKRSRLKTSVMGLGLVRLLQDARRFEEARTTLYSLENGLQGIPYSVISRTTRHGFPAANTPSGMALVTTLPAPMTHFEPILTPGQMIAPPPTHTSDPISIGLPNSCFLRSSAFIG